MLLLLSVEIKAHRKELPRQTQQQQSVGLTISMHKNGAFYNITNV